MKKIIKFIKIPITTLLVISFIACDKDFTSIESDVLGKPNSNFNTEKIDISVLAYNKKLDAVQVNDLPSNLFGIFNDPAYGQTTASLVAQLVPSTFSPDFGDDTKIDSVVLTIPYFTSLTGDLDDNDFAEYSIDSLYGSEPVKVSIYKNDYFLRNLNPDLELNEVQNYFSNANSGDFTNNYALTDNSTINFDDFKGELIEQIASFTPSSENIYLYTYDDDGEVDNIEFETPELRLKFTNTDFWQELIIDKEDDIVLSNINNFLEYFRGLYFKVENLNNTDPSMALLNTSAANAGVTIYYTATNTVINDDDESTTTEFQSTYSLSFSGNTLNTFINDYNINLEDGNTTLGDEKLYLKGTEGSMAIVELFGTEDLNDNDVPDVLDNLRTEFTDNTGNPTKLINEAILVVYEDDNIETEGNDDYHTYDRLYAYDLNNNTVLDDYFFDPTNAINTGISDPLNSTFFHLGVRDTIGSGTGFKIRITEHLNNIIFNDSTNTKLGLVLSNNVDETTNSEILNSDISIPEAAIITPKGTIIHGSNENVPIDRRMKLELYFTEPKK